jgi:hypothetical protein
MAMQIAVNCKQHQAYQYGAFREAFTHTESYYGYRRWSVDASLRIEGCGGGGSEWALHWRSNFHSIESSVRPINEALSAKHLDIYKAILASPGGPTMHP